MPDANPLVLGEYEPINLDWLLGAPDEIDNDNELVNAVVIALGTDARAKAEDVLPNPDSDDRRGWWADTDAEAIWDGWPIGCRLWLLARTRITGPNAREGSTLARVEGYIREALQPFKDKQICTRFSVRATRVDLDRIDADVTLFRGDKPEIALRFQDLWSGIRA